MGHFEFLLSMASSSPRILAILLSIRRRSLGAAAWLSCSNKRSNSARVVSKSDILKTKGAPFSFFSASLRAMGPLAFEVRISLRSVNPHPPRT